MKLLVFSHLEQAKSRSTYNSGLAKCLTYQNFEMLHVNEDYYIL